MTRSIPPPLLFSLPLFPSPLLSLHTPCFLRYWLVALPESDSMRHTTRHSRCKLGRHGATPISNYNRANRCMHTQVQQGLQSPFFLVICAHIRIREHVCACACACRKDKGSRLRKGAVPHEWILACPAPWSPFYTLPLGETLLDNQRFSKHYNYRIINSDQQLPMLRRVAHMRVKWHYSKKLID